MLTRYTWDHMHWLGTWMLITFQISWVGGKFCYGPTIFFFRFWDINELRYFKPM